MATGLVGSPLSRNNAIVVSNLSVAYRDHIALSGINGVFAAGSLTAVVGPNGAGKSTLLAALAGQLRLRSGNIAIHPDMRHRLAFLPQQASVDCSFPVHVIDVVTMGFWRQLGPWRGAERTALAQAAAALEHVGLSGFENRCIATLSVGQFQRVLFARLLLQDASILLMDEPFSAVDAKTTRDLMTLVTQWHAESRTVIAVMHDLDLVRAHFPQTLLLANRPVAWGPTAVVLEHASRDHLHQAHTRQSLSPAEIFNDVIRTADSTLS